MDSKFLRSHLCRAGSDRLSPISARNVSGPSPMGSSSRNDRSSNSGERRKNCGDARNPVRGVLEAQRIVHPDGGSGHSSSSGVGRAVGLSYLLLGKSWKASKTAEFDESVLLDGHLSVALGKALTIYPAGKTSVTPLWSCPQAKYAEDFAKWAEAAGVNVITTHPYSFRHGGASSDAL